MCTAHRYYLAEKWLKQYEGKEDEPITMWKGFESLMSTLYAPFHLKPYCVGNNLSTQVLENYEFIKSEKWQWLQDIFTTVDLGDRRYHSRQDYGIYCCPSEQDLKDYFEKINPSYKLAYVPIQVLPKHIIAVSGDLKIFRFSQIYIGQKEYDNASGRNAYELNEIRKSVIDIVDKVIKEQEQE